jgi:hypothetical protein
VRLAVALGFGEVLAAADKNDIGKYLNDIVPSIALLLTDETKDVRVCAGQSFGILVRNAGSKVIKRVVPGMVAQISEDPASKDDAGPVNQTSIVDGLCLVLKNCDLHLFFLLSSSLLTQVHGKKPSGEMSSPIGQLREFIVVELSRVLKEVTKDHGPKEVRMAAKALHRFCEETRQCVGYLHHFIEYAVRRHTKAIKEPLRAACVQLLIHAFGFHLDAAAGAEALTAFFSSAERIETGVLKQNIPTWVALCTNTTPVSNLSTGDDLPDDEPESNDKKKGKAGKGAGVAPEGVKKGLVIAPRPVIPPGKKIGPNDKYCGKCDKVKPKTKFSKKQVKEPNGVCLMCNKSK